VEHPEQRKDNVRGSQGLPRALLLLLRPGCQASTVCLHWLLSYVHDMAAWHDQHDSGTPKACNCSTCSSMAL
jgi:hypothetical protein